MEDTDLGDVGLEALEAMEAEESKEAETTDNTPEDTGEEEATETEDASEDTGFEGEEAKENDDPEEGEDKSEEDEGSETEDKKEDEPEEKELSDEEFEKMAEKRGYAKKPSEDEKAKADEEKATREKLLAKPAEVDEAIWNEMPEYNKITYNVLPALEARGKNGVVKVKTPSQLPEDFEFANDKARMQFENDLQAQEARATEIMTALKNREDRAKAMETQQAEARKVVDEIESLQKSGLLPTPKAKFGDKAFDDDPAVVLTNEVLEYRAKKASEGYNLSIKDSLTLYKAEHPEKFEKKTPKGDVERKNVAKKVAGASKASEGTATNKDDNKPEYWRPGMTTEEVLDRVLDDMD